MSGEKPQWQRAVYRVISPKLPMYYLDRSLFWAKIGPPVIARGISLVSGKRTKLGLKYASNLRTSTGYQIRFPRGGEGKLFYVELLNRNENDFAVHVELESWEQWLETRETLSEAMV